MPIYRSNSTQGGADTAASAAIETNLVADGKAGWEIFAFEVLWTNGELVAAADWEVTAAITTTTTAPSFISADEIVRLEWGCQNTAGVAVAVAYEPLKSVIMIEPRVTVQPTIYFHNVSTLTAQANTMHFHVYYNLVKLSDLEVLRLLAGGA